MRDYNLEDIDDVWGILVDYEIATEEELKLVTDINGYNMETLNDVIYVRSAYRDIEQLIEYDLTDLRYLLGDEEGDEE
jgi:hypothetical protein